MVPANYLLRLPDSWIILPVLLLLILKYRIIILKFLYIFLSFIKNIAGSRFINDIVFYVYAVNSQMPLCQETLLYALPSYSKDYRELFAHTDLTLLPDEIIAELETIKDYFKTGV